MKERKTALNGIRVGQEPGRVLIVIGDGQRSLTAALDSRAARRIGMAILKGAVVAEQDQDGASEGG